MLATPDPSQLTVVLERLLTAISTFSEAPMADAAIGDLADAIDQVDAMRSVLKVMVTRRPGIGMKRALLECADNLERIWNFYAEALIAPTPVAAQSLSALAQNAIDTAADPIVDARRLQDVAAALNQMKPVPERIFNALDMLIPKSTFGELLASATKIARSALGLKVGDNSSLSYLLLEPIAETSLDPARFKEKLRQASLGSYDPGRLVAIARMSGAITGLADTHRLLVEAAVAHNAAVSADSDERAIVRRTGQFISELYEPAEPYSPGIDYLSETRTTQVPSPDR